MKFCIGRLKINECTYYVSAVDPSGCSPNSSALLYFSPHTLVSGIRKVLRATAGSSSMSPLAHCITECKRELKEEGEAFLTSLPQALPVYIELDVEIRELPPQGKVDNCICAHQLVAALWVLERRRCCGMLQPPHEVVVLLYTDLCVPPQPPANSIPKHQVWRCCFPLVTLDKQIYRLKVYVVVGFLLHFIMNVDFVT